jgi:hypothetical protein
MTVDDVIAKACQGLRARQLREEAIATEAAGAFVAPVPLATQVAVNACMPAVLCAHPLCQGRMCDPNPPRRTVASEHFGHAPFGPSQAPWAALDVQCVPTVSVVGEGLGKAREAPCCTARRHALGPRCHTRTPCLHVLPTRIPCMHVCMCPCAAAGPLPSTRPDPGHLWERGCAPSRSSACSFAFTPRAGCHHTDLGPRSPSNGGRGGGECLTRCFKPQHATLSSRCLVLYLVPHLVGSTLLVQGSAPVWSGPLPALDVASLAVISVASAASSVSLHVRPNPAS